jgi:hypothetical protein
MLFLWPKTEQVIGLSSVGWRNSDSQNAHLGNKGFSMIPNMYGGLGENRFMYLFFGDRNCNILLIIMIQMNQKSQLQII